MINELERKRAVSQKEALNQSKRSLIEYILSLTVSKIVNNTKGKETTTKDLAEVIRPIMDQYQESEMTRKMLGIKNYKDWDAFFDEVIQIVSEKVQKKKQKNDTEKPVSLRSQDLKQKNLF